MTQSEIAARIGVSQMQVSRLLRCSLERLRELAG
jgi:DNA-directed RNA polymerase specialized sigma subunit